MKQIVTTPPSQPVTIVAIKNDNNMKHDEVGWVIQPEKRDLHNTVDDLQNKNANAKKCDFPSQVTDVHETKPRQPPMTPMTKNEPSQVPKSHQNDVAVSEPVTTSGGALVSETKRRGFRSLLNTYKKTLFGRAYPYGEVFCTRFSLCVFVQKNLGSTMQRGFEKHGARLCFRTFFL